MSHPCVLHTVTSKCTLISTHYTTWVYCLRPDKYVMLNMQAIEGREILVLEKTFQDIAGN